MSLSSFIICIICIVLLRQIATHQLLDHQIVQHPLLLLILLRGPCIESPRHVQHHQLSSVATSLMLVWRTATSIKSKLDTPLPFVLCHRSRNAWIKDINYRRRRRRSRNRTISRSNIKRIIRWIFLFISITISANDSNTIINIG